MRVLSLTLARYGHHKDTILDLSGPGQGLTVVLGPNEAGKSTAQRALLAALFGIPRQTPDAHAYGRAGLRIEARIVANDGRELTFVRQGRPPNLQAASGAPLDDGQLAAFLGEVEQPMYERIFSVSHDELRHRSAELLSSQGEIGRLVFGAALGAGSVGNALARLDARARELFKPSGRLPPLNKALGEHGALMKDAMDLRVKSRDWEQLQQQARSTEATASDLRSRVDAARVEMNRIDRLIPALSMVAELNSNLAKLTVLEAEGPIVSPEWANRATDALQRLVEARATQRTALDAKQGLQDRIAGIDVRAELLERGAQIENLVGETGRFTKDAKDLRDRREQLAVAKSKLSECRRKLDLKEDDGQLPSDVELATVEDLAERNTRISTELERAKRELSDLEEDLATEQRRLKELPPVQDVGPLARATDLAKPVVALEKDFPTKRRELADRENAAKALAGRLGLASLSLAEITGLAVPSAQRIGKEQAKQERLHGRLQSLEDEQRQVSEDVAAVEEQAAAIRDRPGVPDPGQTQTAREYRDAGWILVRGALETGAPNTVDVAAWVKDGQLLPDAFEQATRDADQAADDRYDHSQELATLQQLLSSQEAFREKAAANDKRRQQLEEEASSCAAAWKKAWVSAKIEAGTPAEMLTWREDHTALVSDIANIETLRGSLHASEETVSKHKDAVAAALQQLGQAPDFPSLEHLVSQAEQVAEEASEQASARRDSEEALRHHESGRAGRASELADSKGQLKEWEGLWAGALVPLGLEPAIAPTTALQMTRTYRELPGLLKEVHDFESRIRGIERDLDAFKKAVVEAAADLIQTQDRSPVDIVEELKAELTEARKRRSSQETLEGQLVDADDEFRAAESELARLEDELRQLQSEVPGAVSEEDIRQLVDRAQRAAELQVAVSGREADLVSQGGGRTLEQILAEIESLDADSDELSATAQRMKDEVAQLEEEERGASERAWKAQRDLEAVTGSSAAADLEQEAEEKLARAFALADDFSVAAISAWVLRKVIDDYGERNRGPIIDRASSVFSAITEGAFTELTAEWHGDTPELIAIRQNGQPCTISQHSDGTRDQLYLALRLAGIAYQLDSLDEPLPVLFDDVLVNFDDDRGGATLAELAELGKRTQVILFTHHESVAAAAREAIPAQNLHLASLEARDHSAPWVATGEADVQTPALSARRVSGFGNESVVIVEVLRASTAALSKTEILSRSDIDEGKWSQTIRSLVETGSVIQEGQKRGAKYRLP